MQFEYDAFVMYSSEDKALFYNAFLNVFTSVEIQIAGLIN